MDTKLVAAIALSLALVGCATAPPNPVAAECRGIFAELSAQFDSEFAESQRNNWGVWGRRFQGRDGKMRPIDLGDEASPLACAKREWLRKELAAVSCELLLEICRGIEDRALLPRPPNPP